MSNNDWQQGPSPDPDEPKFGSSPQQQDDDSFWGQPEPDSFQDPQQDPFQDPQYNYDQPPVAQPNAASALETNDILAIVLALILPGSGQFILGQKTKGIVLVCVALFTCAGFGLLGIASALDAFCVAKASKRRPVGEWEFFPDFDDAF